MILGPARSRAIPPIPPIPWFPCDPVRSRAIPCDPVRSDVILGTRSHNHSIV